MATKLVLNGTGPSVKFHVAGTTDKPRTVLVIGSKGAKTVTVNKSTDIKFAA